MTGLYTRQAKNKVDLAKYKALGSKTMNGRKSANSTIRNTIQLQGEYRRRQGEY